MESVPVPFCVLSFINPKDTAETAGVGEPTRAGETAPRNGVKHPTTNAKKVAQAG